MEPATALAIALNADLKGPSFMPAIGQDILPDKLLGVSATIQTLAMKGVVKLYPHVIGPRGWTVDQVQQLIAGSPSGGTAVVLDIAIYGDDGTGFPDLATGPLATAQFNSIMTTGTKVAVLNAALALKAGGVYWVASRLDWSVAPSVYPQIQSNANSTWQLGMRTNEGYGGTRGLYSGSGAGTSITMPAAGSILTRADFSVSGGSDIPIMLLHRSA